MSSSDRDRWNARYAAGAYGDRTHPCTLLADWLPEIPRGRALDLACGVGRNAIFLAGSGFTVDAVDISATALARGAERAADSGVSVNWLEQDLDTPQLGSNYALITLIRYADLALVRSLPSLLMPGGVLLVEAHLGGPLFQQTNEVDGERLVGGPGSERFRLPPGSLQQACAGLHVLHSAEATIADPDGRLMALAQFVGRASQV